MPPTPLQTPARYIPPFAMAFATAGGESDIVSTANPLPVAAAATPSPAPLAGSASVTGIVGPFLSVTGRPVMLSLTGTWAGQVKVLRSTDGGTAKLPLTAMGQPYGSYTANLCEPVWDEGEPGAGLYLEITLSSGTVAYRMGQ